VLAGSVERPAKWRQFRTMDWDRFGVWEAPTASFPVKAAPQLAPLAGSLRPCG